MLRPVGRAEMQKVLVLLPRAATEMLEGYLSSVKVPLRVMRPKPQAGLHNPEHQNQEEAPT